VSEWQKHIAELALELAEARRRIIELERENAAWRERGLKLQQTILAAERQFPPKPWPTTEEFTACVELHKALRGGRNAVENP
jgi:hypothetical protein